MSLVDSYEILDLSDAQKWKDYLKQLPIDQQDIYYTPEYYQLYEELGVGKARCFVFEKDGEIALYPFLLNLVNELGYDLYDQFYDIQGAYGYNGIISSTLEKSFAAEFYKEFNIFCHTKNIIAEFTRFHPILMNHLLSEQHMTVIHEMDNVIMDLNIEYYLYKSYEHSTRKNIKKAERCGLTVLHIKGVNVTSANIKAFLNIYYDTMNRNNAADYYFFKESFFWKLFNILDKNTILSFTYKDNQEISAEIIIFGKQIAYSYLGGTIAEYFNFRANDLLKHEIIKKLKKLGLNYYCLGGGSPGVINFKKTFAKQGVVNFYIGKKIHNRKIYDEVIEQWENKNQGHKELSKNILLRYRNN